MSVDPSTARLVIWFRRGHCQLRCWSCGQRGLGCVLSALPGPTVRLVVPRRSVGAVTLADVTAAGVRAALEEFDRVGRETFLRTAGFGRARAYYLERDGRLYDSKAIAGYAHGVSTGQAYGPKDFSGGDKAVAQRLEALGFTVWNLSNPDWTRDEIVLACELVADNGWRQLDASRQPVKELSALLQTHVIHPAEKRNPDFRNPAGVALKTYNIASEHPEYSGSRSNGNRLDGEVLNDFLRDPVEMRALAARIRELVADPATLSVETRLPDPDAEGAAAQEGGVALRAHLRRERDPSLKGRKLADARHRGVPIVCESCGFDFGKVYGARGTDYIECHHRIPLHASGPTSTRLSDLALICSNCHRMIHRTKPWLTVEELRAVVDARREGGPMTA